MQNEGLAKIHELQASILNCQSLEVTCSINNHVIKIMKKYICLILLLTSIQISYAQYTKEKITTILTDGSEKSWNVNGVNTERPEKVFSFNINGSMISQQTDGSKKNMKWTLASSDNIRWFLITGVMKFELIISYDKKGNQYLKLTHQDADKSSSYYEIKLTSSK
jgi:hypothetical protein